jgi:transcriptional regulator
MYLPAAFAQTDKSKLHDFIERHSFGLLISSLEGVPFATHLPFLLERSAGPHGALIGHMAKANPHWRELAGQTVLAVFSGPHVYVSPSWYASDNVVPTWNYTAVHAYGRARLVEDPAGLRAIVEASIAFYEASMPRPWKLDAGEEFIGRMLAQIVGFRLEIERLEGKFKLNQNHPAERQAKVVQELEAQGGPNAEAIAALMRDNLESS